MINHFPTIDVYDERQIIFTLTFVNRSTIQHSPTLVVTETMDACSLPPFISLGA